MPYYKNDSKNMLFIHIPRTGGTSITHYLSNKFNIPLNTSAIYSDPKDVKMNGVSYQHQTYKNIMDAKSSGIADFSTIEINDITYMTCVRNPYHRVFSNLFFLGLMSSQSNLEQVYYIIKDRFLPRNIELDNHVLHQSEFIEGINKNELIIVHLENIVNDMYKLGYTDFDYDYCKSFHIKQYHEFYSYETIELINDYYAADFIHFGYIMLNPNDFPYCKTQ